jgi:hypothetical protein
MVYRATTLVSLAVIFCGSLPYPTHAEALTDGFNTITATSGQQSFYVSHFGPTESSQGGASTSRAEDTAAVTVSDSVRSQLVAEDHRVTVTSFVESLLYVARSEGDTSPLALRIHAIAEAQADAIATTTEALEKTGARSSIKRFIFGNDYANISILKEQLQKTKVHLDELKELSQLATNPTDRAVLTTQFEKLERDETAIEQYIQTHDKATGVLGWMTQFLAKASSAPRALANNSN